MNRITMCGVTVLAASFFFSSGSEALAQQPSSGNRVSMLCKTSAGGPGVVLVTLSNLPNSTIPKEKTLFAEKGGKTIKFQTAEAIPNNGSVTYRASAAAFAVEGSCEG